jgi:hypothetical protein
MNRFQGRKPLKWSNLRCTGRDGAHGKRMQVVLPLLPPPSPRVNRAEQPGTKRLRSRTIGRADLPVRPALRLTLLAKMPCEQKSEDRSHSQSYSAGPVRIFPHRFVSDFCAGHNFASGTSSQFHALIEQSADFMIRLCSICFHLSPFSHLNAMGFFALSLCFNDLKKRERCILLTREFNRAICMAAFLPAIFKMTNCQQFHADVSRNKNG